MAPYLRGAYARNQKANQRAERGSVAKAGVLPKPPGNDNRRGIRFKLVVNRSAICSLTANGKTLEQMQHQINEFSKATVTFIGWHTDASGGEIELVTDRDLEPFVLERLEALGTQLK